ncbi:ATP-binding protein [Salmonella enterica subsp. enterica]|uniref:ATP-binding protein n=1 Tax=Escherichia coli TaxID=562 RepID=UPI0005C5E3F6|nr:ATP-binding protein [Escherichia coli]ECH8658389.1 ATP-binding protein [Salmonella enterica subsp. enterica serovar Nagoya]EED4102260.1 ATP-binding protein [Salmonella enterica subsp. enterica serovar Nagoya]
MTNNISQKLLSDVVSISPQYQRSIRIDSDMGLPDALNGYFCHNTASSVIENICNQILSTNQRGFTLTGPFGGGKSSLAVVLGSAVHSNEIVRNKARSVLNTESINGFEQAFPVKNGWNILPLVGRRGSVVLDLYAALNKSLGRKSSKKISPSELIDELLHLASQQVDDGVIILIDEMGKYLEAAALNIGDDVFFFQELAEAAARSEGRLVIIGILHQSFSQYAMRLGVNTRDDWSKVQGRYIDLPFIAASDEIVELLSKAIQAEVYPTWISDAANIITDVVRHKRTNIREQFSASLEKCWPLHPVMATLLGPISKRQFGQNERSIFGFISSVEPSGFSHYLKTTNFDNYSNYGPSNYWDYLRANLEPSILASSDGHRWAQAVDAVERTESKTSNVFLVNLIKSIAIIDLFRNGSGLVANAKSLGTLFPEKKNDELTKALDELASYKVILFKSYLDTWSVFEGSDFDIDSAISQEMAKFPGINYQKLSKLMGLHPVVAKRHYHKTGTMRWMDVILCDFEQVEKYANNYTPLRGEFGCFILAIPNRGVGENKAREKAKEFSRFSPFPIIIGIPENSNSISSLAEKLVVLENIKNYNSLEGDRIARREVHALLSATSADLEHQLQSALLQTCWYDGLNDKPLEVKKIAILASDFADRLYYSSPRIYSELVNRDNLSSSSVKARRLLLHAMIQHEKEDFVGFSGYPAERGLYDTLISQTGLHRKNKDGELSFLSPEKDSASNLNGLWDATQALFTDVDRKISIDKLYEFWSLPPFGIKKGLLPVIIIAFVLAHKSTVAIYKDGMFMPYLEDVDIDECLQAPARFSLRWVALDKNKNEILEGISSLLSEVCNNRTNIDPLDAARGLVGMVYDLPDWTRKTQKISSVAKSVRDMLLKANDPHKVLFVDLVTLLKVSDGKSYIEVLRPIIKELFYAYEKELSKVKEKLFLALDVNPNDIQYLKVRASAVSGILGDIRLDAFAGRLANFENDIASIEGLVSFAVETPPKGWVDRHIDAAILELSKLARRFREAEAFASVQGRESHSEAIALVLGTGSETVTVSRSFAISEHHKDTIQSKIKEIVSILQNQDLNTEVALAIIAKVGMELVTSEKGE